LQSSGAWSREIVNAYLELFSLFDHQTQAVMPGLDPGIHQSSSKVFPKKMDHRVKPGDDDLAWYDGGGWVRTHRFRSSAIMPLRPAKGPGSPA
jgi:hypothetical protein